MSESNCRHGRLPVSGTASAPSAEISQLACVFSSTTSAPASILGKLNTDKKELAAVEVLLLKRRMFYEQWPGMYCFNNTESFPTAGSCPRGDQ